MNQYSDYDSTVASPLSSFYAPTPPVRVGILSIADALDETSAGAVLEAAGHKVSRRFGHLQPRLGENELRREDVLSFLDLYGHEYALVAIRGWSGSKGAEAELISLGIKRHCRMVWVLSVGDSREAIEAAGATVIDEL